MFGNFMLFLIWLALALWNLHRFFRLSSLGRWRRRTVDGFHAVALFQYWVIELWFFNEIFLKIKKYTVNICYLLRCYQECVKICTYFTNKNLFLKKFLTLGFNKHFVNLNMHHNRAELFTLDERIVTSAQWFFFQFPALTSKFCKMTLNSLKIYV